MIHIRIKSSKISSRFFFLRLYILKSGWSFLEYILKLKKKLRLKFGFVFTTDDEAYERRSAAFFPYLSPCVPVVFHGSCNKNFWEHVPNLRKILCTYIVFLRIVTPGHNSRGGLQLFTGSGGGSQYGEIWYYGLG